MTTLTRSRFACAAVLLTACGGGGSGSNPATLWLAPKNGEADVQLLAHAPPAY